MAAGKSGNSLIDYCLENGCSKIGKRRSLVDKRLDIRLRKYPAACRYGIDGIVILGSLIKAVSVCIEKDSHLVDKCSSTSCTGAVHPLFHGGSEEGYLGVFSSQLDDAVLLGNEMLDRDRTGNHFLLKRQFKAVRQSQSAGTRNNYLDFFVSSFLKDIF